MVGRRRSVALTILIVVGLFSGMAAFTNSGGSSLSPSDQALLQDATARAAYVYNHSRGMNRADAQAIGAELATVLTPAVTTTTGGASSTSTTAPTTTSGSRSTTTSSSTTAPATTSTVPAAGCTSTIGPGESISSAATAGTLCLLGGVYNQTVSLTHPVTVQAAPGAAPIIDGTGIALGKTSDLVHLGAANVTFGQGIEIRNVTGRAITMTGTGDVVQGATVHDVQYNGILAAGTNEQVRNNTAYRTVLSNTNGALGSSGWAEAINTYQSSGTKIVGNNIHDNWGEGIDFIGSSGGVASGNTVTNDYSVLIYVDGSTNVTIDHNRLTSGTFSRSYGVWGVLLASEGGGPEGPVTITNNAYHGTAPAGKAYSTWNVNPTVTQSGNTFS